MIEGFCLEVQPRDFQYIGVSIYYDDNYDSLAYYKYILPCGIDSVKKFEIRGITNCETRSDRREINNVNVWTWKVL